MSTFASFNALFGQPSDPTTHPEFECKYEAGMRQAEGELLDCSIRYGGVPVSDGGALLETVDTIIPHDTVARPPPPYDIRGSGTSSARRSLVRMGGRAIAECVAPSVNCFDDGDFEELQHRQQQQQQQQRGPQHGDDNAIMAKASDSQDGARNENAQQEGNNNASVDGIDMQRSASRGSRGSRGEGRKLPRPSSVANSIESGTSRSAATSTNSVHTKPQDETIHIHAIRVTSPRHEHLEESSSRSPPPLVLLHGYANGALYFYRNLHGLSRHFPTVYSVDMLGWGLSSRPEFVTRDDSVEAAEDFFVEGLEAWREANGIDTMILGGHSLGGYISVAYCERYPDRVAKLLLLSPVGVQEMADPASGNSRSTVQKVAYGVAKSFFDNGWTPGALIRTVGEWKGRIGVERYVDNRLPVVKCPQERTALIGYLYNNAVLPPSGEGCLNRLLLPGTYAINPVCHRIPKLKVDDVVFIYGEKDWMDPRAGLDVERNCRQRRAEGDLDVPNVTVHAVRNAGHLLMIENWEGLNAAVVLSCCGTLDADMAMHRPASFADKKRMNRTMGEAGKMVSAAGSEATEESAFSRESVEIDVTGRYIIEEEEDFVEYGKEATWTESCTGVSIRKPQA